jgi:DNA-binding NarL/FixJ family response regulator
MPAPPASHRVVLADDDDQLCELVARMLAAAGHDVVGRCGDAREILALVREQRPDIAIVDIRMPPGYATDGLDAAFRIQQELPETAVIVLSSQVAVEHAVHVLEGGERSGYLLKKRVTDADFVPGLERVAAGASVVDRVIVDELMAAPRLPDPLDALDRHEREVLALVAEGRSDAAIAARLGTSEARVADDVARVFRTLKLTGPPGDRRRPLAVLSFLDAR